MCLFREYINTSVCLRACVCGTFHRNVTMLLLDYMSSLPRKQPSLLYYCYYYYYLDFKLFLHQLVDYVFSPSLIMLDFVVF